MPINHRGQRCGTATSSIEEEKRAERRRGDSTAKPRRGARGTGKDLYIHRALCGEVPAKLRGKRRRFPANSTNGFQRSSASALRYRPQIARGSPRTQSQYLCSLLSPTNLHFTCCCHRRLQHADPASDFCADSHASPRSRKQPWQICSLGGK